MTNQIKSGTPTSRRQVTLPAAMAGLAAGQAILVGADAGFTLDTYQTQFSGCTVLFNGSFSTTIIGRASASPVVNVAVNPGDPLYYTGGTYDPTTNVTYGGVLDKNSSSPLFGTYDDDQTQITAGTTNTAGVVRIK